MVLDAETRWSKADYTLSTMTTESYIRDPRFKAFGFGYKFIGDAKAHWVPHEKLVDFFQSVDWSTTAVCCHNSTFDVAIMSWVYDAHPCFIFDTLSMARALYGVEVGNSAKKLAERFELPPKGNAVYSTDGLEELTEVIEWELAEYCKHDVYLCEQFYLRMVENFPSKELRLIDMTIKMFTEPKLELDKHLLQSALKDEREKREALLKKLGASDKDLGNNDKMACFLAELNVAAPKKKSPTSGEPIYAFAKKDAGFQALLNSDNEDVVTLCEARLLVKSNAERTRAQRFIEIAERGALPVPLNYYGAATGRWVGTQNVNLQNLKRGGPIRDAIRAPEGHQIVVGDLAQVEPRILAALADYEGLLDIFRSGEDAYSLFGRQSFNMPTLNKQDNPDLRQASKAQMLGCIAGGSLVLTDAGLVPIEDVKCCHRVWDGVEFVSHEGVIFKGEKNVIEYQGLKATPDHVVFTHEAGAIPFGRAAQRMDTLVTGERGGQAVREGEGIIGRGITQGEEGVHTCAMPMHRVREREMDKLGKPEARGYEGVSALYANKAYKAGRGTSACWESVRQYSSALYKPFRCALQGVRSAWNSALLCFSQGVHFVGANKFTAPYVCGGGDRSYGQQWALRAGEPAASNAAAADAQYTEEPRFCKWAVRHSFCRRVFSAVSCCSLRAPIRGEAASAGIKLHGYRNTVSDDGGNCQPPQVQAKVYDIVNAGPRHRFTVSGVIVHNCGFQIGFAHFAAQQLVGFLGAPPMLYDKAFAKQLGVDAEYLARFLDWEDNLVRMAEIPHTCSDQELLIHCVAAKKVVDNYRATAKPVVKFWEFCDQMIERCLFAGGEQKYKCLEFSKEKIRLPSGMYLKYPDIRKTKDAKGRAQWVYGDNASKLYSGRVCENIVQAVARCVMTDGMLRVQKRYPVVLTCHDEQGAIVPDAEVARAIPWVREQMIITPSYLPGVPLDAEVGADRRYGKAKS